MTSSPQIRLLLTGGGTGGHLFPAVAAAQALQGRAPGSEVLFIGTRRKIDTTSLKEYGFKSRAIDSYGLKGKSIAELLKALAILPLSLVQAMYHILRFRPDVALGVGGYVTGPVMLAARCLGVPTAIHEQNSVPGLANRKLGAVVSKVCASLPGSESYFPPKKVIMTGNPVRRKILELSADSDSGSTQLGTILVLGGSQGAHGLNTLVTDTFQHHGDEALANITVIHQTGANDEGWVKEQYSTAGVKAEVAAFFQDMHEVYKRADLLISRAGATTLTELAVLGKPAILIPYPYAADNHQQKNGEYYQMGGGALQFVEGELTPKMLAALLQELYDDPERLRAMGAAMRRLGCPQAADKIVDVCMDLAGLSKFTESAGVNDV